MVKDLGRLVQTDSRGIYLPTLQAIAELTLAAGIESAKIADIIKYMKENHPECSPCIAPDRLSILQTTGYAVRSKERPSRVRLTWRGAEFLRQRTGRDYAAAYKAPVGMVG